LLTSRIRRPAHGAPNTRRPVRARKIEKAKPVEEAAGEKPPAGAGAGGEGIDGGVCEPRLADAVIAIVAPAIAWRTTPAAFWDRKEAKGAVADGAAAALIPAAVVLAPVPLRCPLVPGIGAEDGGSVGGD
jgi:hypothetical protein